MKIKLSNEWPYQLLFLIAVIFSYVNFYELSLAVWLIILFITVKRYYSKTIIILCAFYFALVVFGITRAFFYQHNLYDIIRDISYFIKPIVGLLIGYQCFRSKDNNFFLTTIYVALVISIIHFALLANAFMTYNINYVHQIRYYGGYFSDFETYAVIILIFHKKFQFSFLQLNQSHILFIRSG